MSFSIKWFAVVEFKKIISRSVSAESLADKSCLNRISYRGLGVFERFSVLEDVFIFNFTPGPLQETRLGIRIPASPKFSQNYLLHTRRSHGNTYKIHCEASLSHGNANKINCEASLSHGNANKINCEASLSHGNANKINCETSLSYGNAYKIYCKAYKKDGKTLLKQRTMRQGRKKITGISH
jgi:hypothetical protein